MKDETPTWQKFLPFLALAPAAAIPNGTLFSIPIVALTLLFVKGSRQPTLALWTGSFLKWLLIGIGAGVLLWGFSTYLLDPAIEPVFGKIQIGDYTNIEGNLGRYLIFLALGFTFGGVLEEIIYRSFVIGWGTALFGERALIPLFLLSSIVFGIAHSYYQGVSGGIDTGLSALVFGGIYIAAGRKLLPAMVAHATVDAIGITALYLGW